MDERGTKRWSEEVSSKIVGVFLEHHGKVVPPLGANTVGRIHWASRATLRVRLKIDWRFSGAVPLSALQVAVNVMR